MTGDLTLFDVPAPADTAPTEGLSADRRRTARQHAACENGVHPLALVFPTIAVHPATKGETYAPGDPRGRDFTCGTCQFRRLVGGHAKDYPKCFRSGGPGKPNTRATGGAGTDVRTFWPACVDYVKREDT